MENKVDKFDSQGKLKLPILIMKVNIPKSSFEKKKGTLHRHL